ncbi:hypothetical protein GW17_00027247 [Ensete ventricosum]|nr:hypothetical protein GW17_00027247 [Ensete ventricosum]
MVDCSSGVAELWRRGKVSEGRRASTEMERYWPLRSRESAAAGGRMRELPVGKTEDEASEERWRVVAGVGADEFVWEIRPEESQVAYRSLEPHKNGWISSPPSLSGSTKSKPDSREFSGKTLRTLGI